MSGFKYMHTHARAHTHTHTHYGNQVKNENGGSIAFLNSGGR